MHDGSPQRGAAAGFSAVAALRVLVVGGRAAFSGVGVGAAGFSAVGSASQVSAAPAVAGAAGAVGVSVAVDSIERASAVRAVSCAAAEGVVRAAPRSPGAGGKKDAIWSVGPPLESYPLQSEPRGFQQGS